MTSGPPCRWNRGTTMRRRRLQCWNVAPSIIPLFPLPRRLHRLNPCQGPGIIPCLWINTRRCVVVESPEATEDRAGTTSPVPMSGTKDRPSLVDDSPAMPKVDNLCWGGATLRINVVSPPTTTSPTEDPQPRVLPHFGGGSRGCNGLGACFCFPSKNPITCGGSLVTTIYCGGRIPTTTAAA